MHISKRYTYNKTVQLHILLTFSWQDADKKYKERICYMHLVVHCNWMSTVHGVKFDLSQMHFLADAFWHLIYGFKFLTPLPHANPTVTKLTVLHDGIQQLTYYTSTNAALKTEI